MGDSVQDVFVVDCNKAWRNKEWLENTQRFTALL